MKDKIKSLSGFIHFIIIPLIVIFGVFIICILVSLNSYKKKVKDYTNEYYKYAVFSNEVDRLSEAYELYYNDTGEANYSSVKSELDETKRLFYKVYDARFSLDQNGQFYIESINTILRGLDTVLLGKIKPELSDVQYKLDLVNVYVLYINRDQIINNAEGKFGKKEVSACYVILILSIVCMACLLCFLVMYIINKITKPITDIYEWSVAFKDGYCGMDDLKYDRNDEIGYLAQSFNIVKHNLMEANKLKQDNEEALKKLQSEEDNKKKFVQQLYVEKREKENLSSIAMHDGLTGLYNRNAFDQIVREFLKKRKDNHEGAFFLIDMDYFKNVNDTLGHLMGDEALKTLANTMRDVFDNACLGRYGGDEFIVFMSRFSDMKEIETLAAGLCKKMRMQMTNEGKTVSLSVSIGVTTTAGINDFSELYRKADKSLYISKENGKDRFTISE